MINNITTYKMKMIKKIIQYFFDFVYTFFKKYDKILNTRLLLSPSNVTIQCSINVKIQKGEKQWKLIKTQQLEN